MSATSDTRWEQGSNFDLPELTNACERQLVNVSPDRLRDYGSGRMALQALIDHGVDTRGWRRLWLPSYFCEDVVDTLDDRQISLRRYRCVPGQTTELPVAVKGDALLKSCYFGWSAAFRGQFDGDVIEDLSHAPTWLDRSLADFAFASLRKCLPLPDGALAWSPAGHNLPAPAELTASHQQTALLRLAAMAQKRAYLQGAEVNKSDYRSLEVSTEQAFVARPVSAMTPWAHALLERFDLEDWFDRRRKNYHFFKHVIEQIGDMELITPPQGSDPMIAVLKLKDQTRRDLLRQSLTRACIYTAVLWPQPEGNPAWYGDSERDFSDTTLCVHVDGRYSPQDLERVAGRIRLIMEGALD